MIRLRFIVPVLLVAAGASGCTRMTNGTVAEPFPDSVSSSLADGLESDAVYYDGAAVGRTTARVQMDQDGGSFTLSVGGTDYTLRPDGDPELVSSPLWEYPANYTEYQFDDGTNAGGLYVGRYMAVGGANIAATGTEYLVQAGLETPADGLPAQTAAYEGYWEVYDTGGLDVDGVFDASVDFDAGTIAFAIHDDSDTQIGLGAGTVSGSTFASSFNVTSGINTSVNNVDGNFYGPNAEEMAGLVAGNGTGPTFGFIFGHQK
ncbi:transferrin-binding protein-like solute binding protein [Pelagibacterium xiamenense]|uniref:transferrin-binding protein-like solute binding protein n=1 Tax=Pelagibacterium xiamenense TaxID=2901140 RepID=UPI001E6082B3|nr:transferrin-binding protein-like solute binding protein [Pelagibacterium xiamenense]MCD7059783.1 transferrin-binding protein-like solute binding protein [Pelagibacterium xiamenense]